MFGFYLENQKGFTFLDMLITLCLASLLFSVVVAKYRPVAVAAQESAVRAELANIRMSVKLFKLINGRNPERLNELVEKNVMLPARVGSGNYTGSIYKEKYLAPHALDKQGNIVDAFGNPFAYDPLRGEVRATTKGYESW